MKKEKVIVTAGFLVVTVSIVVWLTCGSTAAKAAVTADLAATPPMGWNSWNFFGVDVNERDVKETADALVKNGLRDLGYVYVTIDDCWQGGRDANGHIYPNPKTFPNGMKSLADYVHGKGLKFGIYTCAGEVTCNKKTASYGHERADAQTFAEWGVDFVKDDYCYGSGDLIETIRRYTEMGDALKATGRPIVFSICEWGQRSPWLWGRQAGGNMWRVSNDVPDMWDNPYGSGILGAIDTMVNIDKHAGPGGWNDPDMLVIGLDNKGYVKGGGCSDIEYRTQMSMWSMFSAPLIIGADVRRIRPAALAILSNAEVIAIDQDPLGKQAIRVARTGSTEVFKKPMSGGRIAVAFLNRGEEVSKMSISWQSLELKGETKCAIRDVWAHADLGTFSEKFSAEVQGHECKVIVMVPETESKQPAKGKEG